LFCGFASAGVDFKGAKVSMLMDVARLVGLSNGQRTLQNWRSRFSPPILEEQTSPEIFVYMTQDFQLIDNLYNAFNPSAPLQVGDATYVNCDEVRGDGDILMDLGNQIRRSQHKSCYLYSGHRGAGKSTELLRLQDHLTKQGCRVVYFAADEEDVNREDTEYTDILLACTRHLLKDLKTANPKPLLNWLKDRWGELQDLAQSPVTLDGLTVELALQQFTKLTANLRTEPTLRYQIRQKITRYTPNLIEALNQFIAESKKTLPSGTKLVLIVDSLDRLAPIYQENGRSNHEEIFLDRSEQLKALDCYLVYTAPISLIYSKWGTEVKENYGGEPQVLPMLMVRTREGEVYQPGLAKMKEIVAKRVSLHAPKLNLEREVFDSPATLERLCLMSGGHMRELISLIQGAINKTGALPISSRALNRASSDSRLVYERAVEAHEWEMLANVFKKKDIENNNQYRSLLFNRCVLEYRYLDEQGGTQCWYNVHPLLHNSERFKEAVSKLQA
jgi:hypothetical protein